MFNARKREASDPLLPTRQPKHPRVEHGTSGATHPGLTVRWTQLAHELIELASETIIAFASRRPPSSPSSKLPPRPSRSQRSTPNSPRRSPQVHTASHSDSLPPRLIPNRIDPHGYHFRSEQTALSSSLPSDRSPMQTVPNPSHANILQSTSTTVLQSAALPSHQAGDALLADSMQQCRRAEGLNSVPSRKKSKEHIFARKHKDEVRENRLKDREAVMTELFDLKRANGFKSSYEDFKSYIDYRARLQHLDDRHALSPSASLTDLRLKDDTPILSHRHSFSDYADIPFLESAKKKLLRTLASPPTKPFSAYEWLRQEARKKDEEIERRFRPSLPKSLLPEMDIQVDSFLAKKGVVSKIAREQVCDKDLSRLLPCQWLNDEIINFYGAMILERSEASKENPGINGRKKLLNVHYFNTFFWSKLQGEGYERARLAKWTKKFDIFSKDVLLIPVNHNNSHWTGAAINFRRKRIESYDSMNLDRHQVFKSLRHYLDLEHQNKKKKPFDFSGWVNHCPDDTPQQENGFDCGVFTCQFLEALSRGEEGFNFSQRDMAYLRRRMIWEIGNAKFLDVP